MNYQQRIQHAFAQAAEHYDHWAGLQQQSMQTLLSMLPAEGPWLGNVADIGGGTGELLYHLQEAGAASPVLLDLAWPMLKQAQARGVSLCMQGHMEALPLQTGTMDALVSNFALQWSSSPESVLAECWRVLRQGGYLAMAVPVAGSLEEIRGAWQQAGLQDPINPLSTKDAWVHALGDRWSIVASRSDSVQVAYTDAKEGLRALSVLGASAQARPRQGLLGRSAFARAQAAWFQLSDAQGYRLRYRVLWWIVQKSE